MTSGNLFQYQNFHWYYIRIHKSRASTVDELKKWLDENPTYIEYIIKEPIVSHINLPEIPTLQGTTIISVDTEIEPSNIEITYRGRKLKD